MFKTEVQFGHAGALANSQLETAATKNKAMAEVGIHVPQTFEEMRELSSTDSATSSQLNPIATLLSKVYKQLVADGTIKVEPEPLPPKIPMDYSWASEVRAAIY